MNMNQKIARINELYHKSKKQPLTSEELAEQKALRNDYIASIRGNLKAQLDNMVIENPDGTQIKLGEKFGKTKNS